MTKRLLSHFVVAAISAFGIFSLAVILIPPAPDSGLISRAVPFDDLPGWTNDDHAAALAAFQKSCLPLLKRSGREPLTASLGGRTEDWSGVCEAAALVPDFDPEAARTFFETMFTPLALSARDGDEGQLTGYFEPLIDGSPVASSDYQVPLYKRPPELVTVNLGLFRKDLRGRRVAGRVSGGQLAPFDSRSEIDAGALRGRGLELFWLRDPARRNQMPGELQ